MLTQRCTFFGKKTYLSVGSTMILKFFNENIETHSNRSVYSSCRPPFSSIESTIFQLAQRYKFFNEKIGKTLVQRGIFFRKIKFLSVELPLLFFE